MNTLNPTLVKNCSYINGQWQPSNGDSFEVTNPANGKTICSIQGADKSDATAAVD
ncbi:MAG: hypothetical protein JKX81_09435, partial [Arenicella sp.]|nr:hypothetical protein [Arenicella sp.]